MNVVYYSGVSENTHRFVGKLDAPGKLRIPISTTEQLSVEEPFILITPTYLTTRRAIPPQVVKFLNDERNRQHLRGVIGTGNTNFNQDYCLAARLIAEKCGVPHLYNLEILGTPEDVQEVDGIIQHLENKEQGELTHE